MPPALKQCGATIVGGGGREDHPNGPSVPFRLLIARAEVRLLAPCTAKYLDETLQGTSDTRYSSVQQFEAPRSVWLSTLVYTVSE